MVSDQRLVSGTDRSRNAAKKSVTEHRQLATDHSPQSPRNYTDSISAADNSVLSSKKWNLGSSAPPAENGTSPRSTSPPAAANLMSKIARSAANPTYSASSMTIPHKRSSSQQNWNEPEVVFLRALCGPQRSKLFAGGYPGPVIHYHYPRHSSTFVGARIFSCPAHSNAVSNKEDSHGRRL